jgi:hypothetical protein
MQARLDRMPEAMIMRRQTVEHPFGTLKAWMGSTHFLTKTLEKVKTEMSLHVLAYNMKRMPTLVSAGQLVLRLRKFGAAPPITQCARTGWRADAEGSDDTSF